MTYSDVDIWLIIAVMGIGTYLIRFSFLGLVGDRKMPDWVLRHLRYTPVAVLPGLVAPLVLLPQDAASTPDPVRIAAALVTLGIGWYRKSMLQGALAGAVVFGLLSWIS